MGLVRLPFPQKASRFPCRRTNDALFEASFQLKQSTGPYLVFRQSKPVPVHGFASRGFKRLVFSILPQWCGSSTTLFAKEKVNALPSDPPFFFLPPSDKRG